MIASIIYNVILPFNHAQKANIYCIDGRIIYITGYIGTPPTSFPPESSYNIKESDVSHIINGRGGLLLPSLCHSHIHIDKCYLLDSKTVGHHARVKNGGFQEAFETTNEAKKNFEEDDLYERGRRLVRESVACGVTAMRCYAEVDDKVGMKCFDIAKRIKNEAEKAGICDIQIAVFVQDPLFKADNHKNRELVLEAIKSDACSVLGTTPYVEDNEELGKRNIEWAVKTAVEHRLHLDLHLDFHLQPDRKPLVHHVISTLKSNNWVQSNPSRTVLLGHVTRLTLFSDAELKQLREDIGDLPIHFAALPRSDTYMMGARRADGDKMVAGGTKAAGARGTIDVVSWIKEYGFNCSLAVNNVGNGFTPHGTLDPLVLATETVGFLQRGGESECELLAGCVSRRAMAGIGMWDEEEKGIMAEALTVEAGCTADFVIVGSNGENRTIQGAVFSPSYDRITIKGGRQVASRRSEVTIADYN